MSRSSEIDRRALVGLGLAAAPTLAAAQEPPDPAEVLELWPGRPPGAPADLPQDVVTDRAATSGFQDRIATRVGRPRLTVFRPTRPNGAAVIIAPGGTYVRVVIDKEGFETARRLAQAGVTAFVLRYRLPIDGWVNASEVPLQDAQRAIRLVRAHAAHYGVHPRSVAMMGFSAGGHVAASLATRHADRTYAAVDAVDAQDARPDLSALIYPVIDMSLPHANRGSRESLLGRAPTPEQETAYSLHRRVDPTTPPTFLVHAMDDQSVPVENSLQYLAALRAAGVPAEAHLFEEGGHGFGIRLIQGKPAAAWPDLFLAWAERRGLFRR
ncbi:alpha/beta hydrolase [Phenylobacterium sp.]|uniref:alpha/beta hydrolase n=1 Tax=Phenylobacterium sp. TaxID=1871053 RepID=UPI00281276F8|nr:alpha/beta hydrolase [Phenylobacterium sp.]